MIGDFRLTIFDCRKAKLDGVRVNFGFGELINRTARGGLRGEGRLGHLI